MSNQKQFEPDSGCVNSVNIKQPVIRVYISAGYIDSVPSLREFLIFLAKSDYSVEIFMPEDRQYHSYSSPHPRIVVRKIAALRGPGKVPRMLALVSWIGNALTSGSGRCHLTIGVDAEGLMMAGIAGWKNRCPVCYYSLEILCTSEAASFGNLLIKRIERWSHGKAVLTFIQDEHREKLLRSENRMSPFPVVYIPNASSVYHRAEQNDYLRRHLHLPAESIIVLHSGSMAPWTQCLELAKAARSWPRPFIMVFQCRQRPVDSYGLDVCAIADQKKVWVLNEPLGSEDFDRLVESADIGIALYKVAPGNALLGKNLEAVGRSSGKIAAYLRSGIPVITSRLDSLEYIDKYQAGARVECPSQIEDALLRIAADRNRYSSNATDCYTKEFDLSKSFREADFALKKITGCLTNPIKD